MTNNRKEYLQRGEQEFIKNVVNAVIRNDTSKTHYLIDDYGLMRYESFSEDKDNPIWDIVYQDGRSVKVVCVFGRELIVDMHFKAGNDDLTRPWVKRAVKSVIAHGKQVAEIVYRQHQ